ncbi:MAG: ATPase, partial [Planctomycetes bacterium]|nr:ATPase [Planctomycetota bacterium]
MIARPFWIDQILQGWRKAPIVWLSGVRRAGKTTLAAGLADALYLNCDLPSVQQRLADPEAFYRSVTRSRLILDEVHQLPD